MDHWIAKAEAALRTGQPNMAELYMRRGLEGPTIAPHGLGALAHAPGSARHD